MRLSQFILQAKDSILAESIAYAGTIPALRAASPEALRNHLSQVLDTIAQDLVQPQSRDESIQKSQGHAPASRSQTAAQYHGSTRAHSGLSIVQLVAEFRVLRSCVLRQWAEAYEPDAEVIQDTLRFNEAVDQAVAESVAVHHAETEKWREIFLGVLAHDLRGPLNALLMSAILIERGQGAERLDHAGAMRRNGLRLKALLDALLDYNMSVLGSGIELQRHDADLAEACLEELEMLRQIYPSTPFESEVTGDTRGSFDASRIRQALGNLISNASHYSPRDSAVKVTITGLEDTVEVSTENEGAPIDAATLHTLFEPLKRHRMENDRGSGHLGLGLFVVREIARAHGGEVEVTAVDGLVRFTMKLPKSAPTTRH